jgi:glycine/D-amino acid oxidase-like deaminating enzyme
MSPNKSLSSRTTNPSGGLVNRRNFLRSTATATAFAIATQGPLQSLFAQEVVRRFAPVKVSRDRIIREIVGLRPFRPEGYLVEAQRVGAKLLIHNYGHGGAGITLSWGTAAQAIELAREPIEPPGVTSRRPSRTARRFAVIGCGVNGLSTAILLQRHFSDGTPNVTIYAKDLPPDTTSNIAGGFWSPTSAYDSDKVSPKFIEHFRSASRTSNRAFQLLVGPQYGVRWLDTFDLLRSEAGLQHELPGGNDLYPQHTAHRNPDRYFGFPFVRQYSTMLIEPSIYLAALLRDFYGAGGRLVVKEFRSREEVMRLPESVILNCTGLGARALFDDKKLIPARGQLEILLPQPEVDYCYLGPGYMFPRTDGIVLGGTFDRENWSLAVDPDQATSILNSHTGIMNGMKSAT